MLLADTFASSRNITISEWSSAESNNASFIRILPHSDYILAAKQGETQLVLKNYMNIGILDRTIETALTSITSLIVSETHKLFSVFDSNMSAFLQYQLPEIGCPTDMLVASCSPLFTYDEVRCVKNAVWNLAEKRCYCSARYYFDRALNTCSKCNCPFTYQSCRDSSEGSCSDDPYWSFTLDKDGDSVDSAVQIDATDSTRGMMNLWTAGANTVNRFEINLKSKTKRRLEVNTIFGNGKSKK